jgi:hypothetical protein
LVIEFENEGDNLTDSPISPGGRNQSIRRSDSR